MDATTKKLSMFMRRELGKSRPEDGKLESFQLRSAGMGKKGAEVDTFPIPEDLTIDNVNMYVEEVMARAQEDADGNGSSRQRYIVVALASGEKDGPRHSFALRGEGDEDEGDGVEQPTEKGLVAQSMRHTEAAFRMALMGSNAQIVSMTRRIAQLEEQNSKLNEDRARHLEALESARTIAHERDMEAVRVEGEETRKSAMFNNLQSLLPLVVNKISGQKLLPEGTKGDAVKSLIDSLSPEQFQQLGAVLTPEQQVIVLSLAQEVKGTNGQPS